MADPRDSFFPKRRIRVELTDWRPKRNVQGEKRLRLDFTLPLIDKNRDGLLPEWLISPLSSMEMAGSVEDKVHLGNLLLEGVTLEAFDTDSSSGRTLILTATTLQDFTLEQVTRDKQTFPALCFNTNVKRGANLLKWADKFEAMYLWLECTPADPVVPTKDAPGNQMSIGDAGATAPPDDGMPNQDPEAAARVAQERD